MEMDSLVQIASRFTEHEKAMFRWLLAGFHNPGSEFSPKDAARELGIDYVQVKTFFSQPEPYGLVRYPSKDYVVVLPRLVELSGRILNDPPPRKPVPSSAKRDFPKEAEVWFRSQRWSVAVYLVIALVGILATLAACISGFKGLGW